MLISSLRFSQNPYSYYENLRLQSKVHRLPELGGWLITGFDECASVLNNAEIFSSSVNSFVDPVLLGTDPPVHTRNKSILQSKSGMFSQSRIAQAQPRVAMICDTLLNELQSQNTIDIVSQFAVPFSSLVMLDLLGIDAQNTPMLAEWTSNAVSSKSIHNKEYAQSEWEKLKPVIESWIDACVQHPNDSGLSEIVHHETAKKNLSKDDLLNLVKILLIGGNETTPNLIASALLHLLLHSDLMLKVRNDHSLIPLLIQETLRFEAPTQMVNRIAATDTEISGVKISKGEIVAVCIGAANRDPDTFNDADVFDIHRTETKSLAFGYGPHYCIGSHLAKLEAGIALEKILNTFPELNLPKNFQPVYKHSSHIRGMKNLPVLTQKNEKTDLIYFVRKEALQLIRSSLTEAGEIPTLEYFPHFEPKKHKGWHYTFPSPFIHANVMYSLLNSNHTEAVNFAKEMVPFLIQTKEPGDIWRFWKMDNCENPVPPDIDDTSICSFVLNKLGYPLNNKKLLQRNITSDGKFLTWIFPDTKMLFSNLKLYFRLHGEKKTIQPTLTSGMLHHHDSEIGVTANALMYLGENDTTMPAIQRCISDWNNNADAFNFYGEKIVVAYHIARAFKENVSAFRQLSESIENMIEKEAEGYVFAEQLLAYLTLSFFNKKGFLTDYLKTRILNHCMLHSDIFENYAYFTSKDRVFFAGSPALTASWFLEAAKDWQ